jgi:Na+-driven multidrug efflux pump
MLVYNFCASALRASGDTKHPTAFLVAGGVLNVILNLITVIAFGLGVAGVAIATVASQCLSASLTVGYLFRIRGACRLSIAKLRLDRSKLLAILRVGIPAGLQSVAFSISNVLIQSSINSFGSLVMEGNAASANLGGFIYVSMNAFCHAAMAFVGQNVGARLYERLRRIMTACIVLVTVIGLAVGWGVYLFREPLIYLYRPGEAYVLEYGTIRLSVIATTYFLGGIVEVVSGALRGMGSSVGPTAISLIGICVLRIVWIETAFRVHRTLYVLYLSYPLSWIATILMLAVLYYIRKRRLLRGAAQTEDGERRGEAEEDP